MLTQKRLKELIEYDHITGIFTRIVKISNISPGDIFGCISKNGYLRGHIDGKLYYCHRLAFLYMDGYWPHFDVDHVNGNRKDNKWDNLRQATRSENLQNREEKTKAFSGIRNVYFDKPSGKWQVKIMIDGKSKSFGYFTSIEDASNVAKNAKKNIHTFNPEFLR